MNKVTEIVKKVSQVPFIDRILGKTMSKKLTVFFIGTLFLFLGKLDSAQWVEVCKFYLIGQSAVDLLRGKSSV